MSNYPLILGWSLREEYCVGFQNIEICQKEYNPRGACICRVTKLRRNE